MSANPGQQNLSIVKYAHVGGEVSEAYASRSDLAKYDLALALAENWFVDYHGGISTAPGLELIDNLMNDDDKIKLYKFSFASNIGNTYIIIMGKNYLRFVQDGGYVLEAFKAVTNIAVAGPVVTVSVLAHGYAVGDWVKFGSAGSFLDFVGGTYKVASVTTNTFTIVDPYGNAIDTTLFGAFSGAGTVARIYTIAHSFATADFEELKAHQIRDTIYFTKNEYPVYALVRIAHTNWTLTAVAFLNKVSRVTAGLTATPATAGTDNCVYCITTTDANGVESLPSLYAFCLSGDMSTANKINTIVWTAVTGAQYYTIYRSRITGVDATKITAGMQMGYIGTAIGATFTDPDITPDFTVSPPQDTAPFVDGTVLNVVCTTPGTGYGKNSAVSISDPNGAATGFIGQVILAAGTTGIAGILVISGGSGYTTPTITVATGSGAVFSVEVQATGGNNPATSTVYQQRKVYGATVNKPLTVFGSQPGKLTNFSTSDITVASDAYSHEIDSEDFSPIRHLVPMQGGLVVMNAANVWLMSGENGIISATNVQVDFQTAIGATQLPPLKVNHSLFFCENAGGKVIELAFVSAFVKLYQGTDMSLLANHLFSKQKKITAWGYAAEPYKMVWARRNDGLMLNFTVIKEQEIFAWTRRTTKGAFIDVITLDENNQSSVYCVVERYVNGRYTKFLERVTSRDWDNVEDAFHVDAGLRVPINYPAASVRLSAATGIITVTADASVFTINDVGKIFRAGGGKGTVTGFTSGTIITVTMDRDVIQVIPFTVPIVPRKFMVNEWSLDSLIVTIVGLSYLEGEIIYGLADGKVIGPLTVTHGRVTLTTGASRICLGIKYRCVAKNLPLTTSSGVIENKRQRIVAMQLRVKDTQGLKIGTDIDHLYPVPTESLENYQSADPITNGLEYVYMEPIWSNDARYFLVQDDPLPATVLGHVMEVDVGDTEN